MHQPSEDCYGGDESKDDGEIDRDREDDVDEFGRKKSAHSVIKTKKKQREWPPCFDKFGTAFVFDSRSGMFYEQESDFFYDPQSKMYFGNRNSTYYRYNAEMKPPFEVISKVDNSTRTGVAKGAIGASADLDVVLGNVPQASTKKPGIAIKLKTKKLPNAGQKKQMPAQSNLNSVATSGDNSSNPLKRQHHKDMDKWSERQEELKNVVKTEDSEAKKRREISRTSKGEPICTLCQRKFPTLEKLLYHERVSKLHSENLRKAEEAKKERSQTESPKKKEKLYMDRAQQRRDLFGSDTAPSRGAVALMTDETPPEEAIAGGGTDRNQSLKVVRPEETLGESNVGNKMLQKLGWTSGQTLGRRQEPDAEATVRSSQVNLKNDWERIEALAQRK